MTQHPQQDPRRQEQTQKAREEHERQPGLFDDDLRDEYTPEEIRALMEAKLDIPEGDIDENAAKALAYFDIDIDALLAEIKIDMDIRKLERDLKKQEPDFGR